MEADARRMRPGRPFVFSNLKDGTSVDAITRFIGEDGRADPRDESLAAM